VSRYQKGKTNLDFTEARYSEWQWNQLDHMQVCTSLQTDNHANTHHSVFLQAGCPSCHPTNSVKALKATSTLSGSLNGVKSSDQVPQLCQGKDGNVTSSGWQVTLSDCIWHVSLITVGWLQTAILCLLTYWLQQVAQVVSAG